MSNNTPNNTALTAEEKAEQLYPYPDFSRYSQLQEYIFTYKINNQRQAFVEGAKYSASALSEKDREIERLKRVKWKFCPECGSTEIVNENLIKEGFRECRCCGQQWWMDVDYTDTIQKVLTLKHSQLQEAQKSLDASNGALQMSENGFAKKCIELEEAQKELEELKRSEANPYNQHIKELTDAKIELLEKSNSILTKNLQATRDMCERLGTAFGAVSEWAKCGVFHNCPRPDDYPEQHSVLNASLAVLNEFRRLKNQQSPSQEGEKTT